MTINPKPDTSNYIVFDPNVSSGVTATRLDDLIAWAEVRLADEGDAPVVVERWDGVDQSPHFVTTFMGLIAGRTPDAE